MLEERKVLIGVSGSIAAYKIAILVRLLKKTGINVKVIMTHAATTFITPLTLATLSENIVFTKLYNTQTGEWYNHVELAMWADVLLIAPATASTIAKMTYGFADNLLITTYMSAKCPVFIAPAMDADMYTHHSTTDNLDRLRQYGNNIIDVEEGYLASGLLGKGRMAEPENIFKVLTNFFTQKNDLSSKNIMITAGPTQEFIDPVRYISNPSSGKMGYAIAEEMAQRGGSVNLISGPVKIQTHHPNINIIKVNNANEMHHHASIYFRTADIVIFAAAVVDYRPKYVSNDKIKKQHQEINIILEKNIDIAHTLGQKKHKTQFLVGFALETNNEIEHAKEKLITKNLDCIILNSLKDQGAGFDCDTNKIIIIDRESQKSLPLKSKISLAKDIVDHIVNRISSNIML